MGIVTRAAAREEEQRGYGEKSISRFLVLVHLLHQKHLLKAGVTKIQSPSDKPHTSRGEQSPRRALCLLAKLPWTSPWVSILSAREWQRPGPFHPGDEG